MAHGHQPLSTVHWPGQVSWAGTVTLDICRWGQTPLERFGHIWPSPRQDASHVPCLGGNSAGKLQPADCTLLSPSASTSRAKSEEELPC